MAANPMIFVVIFLLIAAVGGGLAWYFLFGPGKADTPAEPVTPPAADDAAVATPSPSSYYKSEPTKYGDIFGFDTLSPNNFKGKTTVDDCAKACTDTLDCKSFVYNTTDPAKPFCLGKTTNDLNRSHLQKDALLYYKPLGTPSSYYKSDPAKYGDIYDYDTDGGAAYAKSKFFGKTTLDDCAQACNDTPNCKSFVYNTTDPAKPGCWGKTTNDLAKSYLIPGDVLYWNVR